MLRICSGGPARGTEAQTLQTRNTATAGRTLFLSQGEVLTVLTYHKSQTMQDGVGKTIVRYLDTVTWGLVHVYLLLINPLQYLLDNLMKSVLSGQRVSSKSGASGGCRGKFLDHLFSQPKC